MKGIVILCNERELAQGKQKRPNNSRNANARSSRNNASSIRQKPKRGLKESKETKSIPSDSLVLTQCNLDNIEPKQSRDIMIMIIPQSTSPRKNPLRLRRATAQAVANLLVFLAHGVPGNLLPGGPDFSRLGFFALEVFRDDFADLVLEVKGAFGSMTVSILRRGAGQGC